MEERTNGQQSGGVFKSLVYNGAVSLTLIDGGTFCAEGIRTHALTGVSAESFASALLFAAFAGADLKEPSGEVSCTVKTDGRLKNVTVSCSADLDVRGCIDEAEENERGEFGRSGFLQVVHSDAYSRPFVGACALIYGKEDCRAKSDGNADDDKTKDVKTKDDITKDDKTDGGKTDGAAEFFARNFKEYFRQSEQLPTEFVMRADEKNNAYICAALQALPGSDGTWESAAKKTLGALVEAYGNEREKNGFFQAAERAAARIFKSVECKKRRLAAYRCKCSREYLKGVLASLGKEEINSILNERGKITAHCHYCNKDYAFTKDDLKDLL